MRSRLCIHRTESQKAKHVLCADNRMLVRKLMNALHRERENHRNVVGELRQLITDERRNCNEFLREMHTILTDIAADKRQPTDCDDDCSEVSIIIFLILRKCELQNKSKRLFHTGPAGYRSRGNSGRKFTNKWTRGR